MEEQNSITKSTDVQRIETNAPVVQVPPDRNPLQTAPKTAPPYTHEMSDRRKANDEAAKHVQALERSVRNSPTAHASTIENVLLTPKQQAYLIGILSAQKNDIAEEILVKLQSIVRK